MDVKKLQKIENQVSNFANKRIKNREIRFNFKDYVSIFFINCCPFLFRNDNLKHKKLKKLYDIGYEKIKENLDILKIMKDLTNFKIVLEHSIMT